MSSLIDFSQLDLRDAFDLAIKIEEDAQRRYEQLAAAFADDAEGIGEVFRTMAVNERKHRDELAERRYSMLREDAQPSDLPVAGGEMEGPEPQANPESALAALELVLESEQRALAFYREALERVPDRSVRALFEDLRDEEAEHVALVTNLLGRRAATAA